MKSNAQLQGLVQELKKLSTEQDAAIWKRIASDLEKSTRNRRIVNLTRINKHSKENEVVVVPGKVLGNGDLDHPVTVAAFNFSKQALEKMAKSNATPCTIYELAQKNPKGNKVRIIG